MNGLVLLIAVLSAIALPKYTKAVEKAHALQAVRQMDILTTAFDTYISSKGFPASYIGKSGLTKLLGVEIPSSENFGINFYCYEYASCFVIISQADGDWNLAAYRYKQAPSNNWYRSCDFSTNVGKSVCKELVGEGFFSPGSYW